MIANELTLQETALDGWIACAEKGIANAISGLSRMVGQEAEIISLGARKVAAKEAAGLLGGPEVNTIGIYLGIDGCATGHLMLVYNPKTALQLVDMLMEVEPGSTKSLGDMERSALGEIGNIMGSYFVNAVADTTDLRLQISPPAVMIDMAGAILDAILAEIMRETNQIVVVETTFDIRNRQVDGMFFVFPSADLRRILLNTGKPNND